MAKKTLYEENGEKHKEFRDFSKRELIAQFPKSEFIQFKRCLIKQIQLLAKICDVYKVRYRLDCGTLLGMHRGGDLIFPDFDNDLGVCMEDINLPFIMELSRLGLFRDIESTMYWGKEELINALHTDAYYKPKVLKIKDPTSSNRFFGNRVAITTDLFFWVTGPNNCQYSSMYTNMELVQKNDNILPLKPIETKYGTLNFVANPDEYLSDMYGDDWKIPNSTHRDIPGNVRGLQWRWDTGDVRYNYVKKTFKVFSYVKNQKYEIIK